MNRATKSEVVLYGIQFFGTIVLLLLYSVFLSISGEISAILMGAAYILYGLSQAVRVHGKSSLSLAALGVFVLILGVVCLSFVIINDTVDAIIGFALKCFSGLVLIMMVAPQSMLNYSKRYSIGKGARKLVNLAYGLMILLIIGGAALTIFLQFLFEFPFYLVSIVGCALWFAATVYNVYLMLTHEYDDTILETEKALFRFLHRQ